MRITISLIWILTIVFFGQTVIASDNADSIGTLKVSTVSIDMVDTLTQAVSQSNTLNDTEKNELTLQLEQAKSWILSSKKSLQVLNSERQNAAGVNKREKEINVNLAKLTKKLEEIKNFTQETISNDRLNTLLDTAQKALDLANNNYLKWDNA
jgi:hypothetical protein